MNIYDTIREVTIPNKYSYKVVTKSYRKGRMLRVQNIYDKNGFVVKQIIHRMF